MKISLVLLAAGNSRRFHGNKLLENVDGKPMYLHIVDEIEKQAEDVFFQKIVVTQYEEIAEQMEARGYTVVRNFHSEEGISVSIKLGLEKVEGEAACFAVCDQPYLKGSTVRGFLAAWEKRGLGLGCLAYQGVPGNPAVFSRKYFPQLQQLEGDQGGRKVLARHEDDLYMHETEDGKELEDIDNRRNL